LVGFDTRGGVTIAVERSWGDQTRADERTEGRHDSRSVKERLDAIDGEARGYLLVPSLKGSEGCQILMVYAGSWQ
jgi:hypothetical protein